MKQPLQLEEFFIARLHVDWRFGSPETEGVPQLRSNLGFDYDVLSNADDPLLHALELKVIVEPEPDHAEGMGYAIEAHIIGFFRFEEGTPEEEMQYLVRVNGGTILYGILRGQLAAFTGSFPNGKYMLPSVYMQDVVKDVEERKKREREKANEES